MGQAFIIDWDLRDIQNQASRIEAMGQAVCGTEAYSPEHAVEAIQQTQPDLLILWANSHLERSKQVLQGLQSAAAEVPPVIYVDADREHRQALEAIVPGSFVPTIGLEAAIKEAARQLRR